MSIHLYVLQLANKTSDFPGLYMTVVNGQPSISSQASTYNGSTCPNLHGPVLSLLLEFRLASRDSYIWLIAVSPAHKTVPGIQLSRNDFPHPMRSVTGGPASRLDIRTCRATAFQTALINVPTQTELLCPWLSGPHLHTSLPAWFLPRTTFKELRKPGQGLERRRWRSSFKHWLAALVGPDPDLAPVGDTPH